MESSKRYNSVPVRDNCALFAPTTLFSGPGFPTVSFKFLPWRPPLPWQRIWDRIDYNLAPVKDNCGLFAPTPIFGPGLSDGVNLICPMTTSVAMATNRSYSKTKLATGDIVTSHINFFCTNFLYPLGGILETVNKFIVIKSNTKNLDKIRLKTAKIRAKNFNCLQSYVRAI